MRSHHECAQQGGRRRPSVADSLPVICDQLRVFVPAALSQGIVRMKTECLVLQIFRSVAGSVCQLLSFVAVRSIPLLVAVLLSNGSPLFIPIAVYIWFRKAVQPLV